MKMHNTLPPLRGSPKQITWAEDIRKHTSQQLQAELANHLHLAPVTRQSAEAWLEEAARRIVTRQPQEAAWWIERRKRLLAVLQADITTEAMQLAVDWRADLLASIHTNAAGLGRTVPADVEARSLDALADEEAILLRLARIQRLARGRRWDTRVEQDDP